MPASLSKGQRSISSARRFSIQTTHAPAVAASCAKEIDSFVDKPPTPATIGRSVIPASLSVDRMYLMMRIRSSGLWDVSSAPPGITQSLTRCTASPKEPAQTGTTRSAAVEIQAHPFPPCTSAAGVDHSCRNRALDAHRKRWAVGHRHLAPACEVSSSM